MTFNTAARGSAGRRTVATAIACMGLATSGAPPAVAQSTGTNAQIPPAVSGDTNGTLYSFTRASGFLDYTPGQLFTYHVDNPGLELPQVQFDTLAKQVGTGDFANFAFIFTTTNYAGVLLNASYVHTNPTPTAAGDTYAGTLFGVTVPCLRPFPANGNASAASFAPTRTSFNFAPSPDGSQYGVVFTDATPQAAYQDYVNYLHGNGPAQLYTGSQTPTGAQFRSDVFGCSAQTSVNPLVGSPQSLQFSQIDAALDPEQLGSVFGNVGDRNASPGDATAANLIGVQYGRSSLTRQDGNRVDASYQRAFRLFPGSRTLLVVTVPLTFFDVRGGQQFRGIGSVGLVVPVRNNWVVEPRVSYGGVTSDNQGISGQSVSASVASQYAIYNHWLGRGRLVLGNMIGYTQVTDVQLAGAPVSRHPGNIITRNGLAYEYPLKTQFDGRVASLRASYTYTYVDGSKLFLNQTHDVSLSIGVRSRETTLKNSYEILRIGLRGELGDKYNAVYLFGGYRF